VAFAEDVRQGRGEEFPGLACAASHRAATGLGDTRDVQGGADREVSAMTKRADAKAQLLAEAQKRMPGERDIRGPCVSQA